MFKKFKELNTVLKIVVGIIALALLPITLILLGGELVYNGVKSKKVVKIVGGAMLVLFTFAMLPTSDSSDTSNVVKDEPTQEVAKEEPQVEEQVEEVVEEEPQVEEPVEETETVQDNTKAMQDLINKDYIPIGSAINEIAQKVSKLEFSTEEDRMEILKSAVVIKLGAENVSNFENTNPKYEQLDSYLKSGASSYKEALDLILNVVDGDFSVEKIEKATELINQGTNYTKLATEEIKTSGLVK